MNTYEIARLAERAQMAKDAQRAQFGSIQSAPSLNVMGKMGERTFHVDPTRPRNTLAGMFESAMNMGQFVPDVPAMAKVYHGSPHLFKKFRTDKIGTGEGAQAYGHGLYFAENPAVAREYRDRLASGQLHNPDGSVFNPFEHLKNRNVRATLQKTDGDIQRTIARANELIESIPNTQGAEYAKKDIEVLSKLQGLKRPQSNLYKADIPDKQIAKMLDWDKPLRGQGKAVLGLADKYGVAHTADGGTLVQMLKGNHELREIGIPGIKYLDQGSRANKNYRQVIEKTPDGWLASNPGGSQKLFKNKRDAEKWSDQRTRNYVVFDEKLPTIEEINSKVVTRKLR
jgi:hypothetical protein